MNLTDDDLDLEVLRSINADISADPAALTRIREQLSAPTPTRVIVWPKLLAVAVAVATVGAGAAFVTSELGTPSPSPAATATPRAAVAQFAADAARVSLLRAPLAPGPGHYRKVTANYKVVKGVNVQTTGATSRADQAGFRQQSRRTMWVPSDPSGTWAIRAETWLVPVDAASAKYMASHPEMRPYRREPVERAKRGAFDSTAPYAGASDWGSPSKTFTDKLPHDPDALLASAKAWNHKHGIANDPENLLSTLTVPLTAVWVDDVELRAALFTAISKVDGLEINRKATVAGITGISLKGKSDAGHDSWGEVLFSADDYQVLATQWHVMPASGNELQEQVTYTSEIVNKAP